MKGKSLWLLVLALALSLLPKGGRFAPWYQR